MKNFWTFYQNIETVEHPFRVFGVSHLIYILLTAASVVLLFRTYKKREETGRIRMQRVIAIYLFVQEMFFYAWTYAGCQTDPLFEVLQLELCTVCLFMDFSTLFHKNKQVRFFGTVIGFIGGPIALLYPATVADIYPAFSYRLINFVMTHGAYILFALMLMSDRELLTGKRLVKNLGITACMLTAVYFFDLRFGTQYMFVGTPPEIGIIRLVYDLTGPYGFLPAAIAIFSGCQCLVYAVVKKLQRRIYPETAAVI